jgi:hypothetical protein
VIFWIAAAWAGAVYVAPLDGPIRPGVPARLEVVVVDDRGRPVPDILLEPAAGEVIREPPPAAWITAWSWVPPNAPGDVTFVARWPGGTASTKLAVVARPPSTLPVPARLDVGPDSPIVLDLGRDGPPPEALAVAVNEPAEVTVSPGPAGTRVVVAPRGAGARNVLVVLQDRRTDAVAHLVRVRVVERPTLSVQLEPTATLTIRVGGRSWGPFRADESGRVRAVIEQRPGDTQAELVVSDAVGNTLVTPYLLSGRPAPALVAWTEGAPLVGAYPPELWVAAVNAEGGAWRGEPPRCRVVGAGEVVSVPGPEGVWRGPQEVRAECRLGETRGEARVSPATSAPASLDLRVWPEEVSTDFPVAEVTVHVVDAAGERVAGDSVEVVAQWGQVSLEPGITSRKGEYRGSPEAVREGQDTVTATFRLPPGQGPPARVVVGHGKAGAGVLPVWALVTDARGLPLPGIPVTWRTPGGNPVVTSDTEGRVRTSLPFSGPMVLSAQAGAAYAGLVVPPEPELRGGDPTEPDLKAVRTIRLSTGRVSAIRLVVDPERVEIGPGATANLKITLLDRSENVVTEEVPRVEADAGSVGPPLRQADGSFSAVWTAPGDGRPRTVTLSVRPPAGTASATARIQVEPRPVRSALGASVGAVSNFGLVRSLVFAADLDQRLAKETGLFLRVGASGYTTSAEVDTGVGVEAKRLTLLPSTVGLLVRRERGLNAGWAGLGGAFAPFVATATLDEVRLSTRSGLLPPGFGVWVGGARRAGVGEVSAEVRGTFLASPGGASGFTGQLGGLALLLGYRFTIE